MRWQNRGQLCNETEWNMMTRLDVMIGDETGFFDSECEASEQQKRDDTGRQVY